MIKEVYYVFKFDDGTLGRIAKFVDGIPYGYDNGKWVEMNGLYKIQHEITPFEEISKEVADRLIEKFNDK